MSATVGNVVVVLTDDQGPWAMPHLMPELQMPHLAGLRTESVEFTQAYCASPVCSPARASMLTGRTPSAHGVHDWLAGGPDPRGWPDLHLDGQPTTPEVLARAGFRCGLSGKWHVGDARRPAPGFEYWYAHRAGGGPYYDAPVWRDGAPVSEPGYLTDAITDHAVEFLDTQPTDRRFWLTVNYTAPHTPWSSEHHPDALTGLYAGCDFPSVPRPGRHRWARGFDASFADPVTSLIGYAAALTGVDRGLGRIRQALASRGLADDTMIVFVSDNGFSCGHHGIWGKGNGTWPLNFFDNSVRVPLLVHLPNGPRGHHRRPVSTRWLHRTVCELTGVEPEDDRWGDPGSFASALTGAEPTPDTVVVTAEYGQGRMITDGRYVLVVRSDRSDELYDHDRDPTEQTDFVDDPTVRGVRADLTLALQDWFGRHERAGHSAFTQPVTGLGQLTPLSRGHSASRTYVQQSPPAAGSAPAG